MTTTWLLTALLASGLASWWGRGSTTPIWRDYRLLGGVAAGAIGLAVPPAHFMHGALLAGSFGLLGSFVATEAAVLRSNRAPAEFGAWGSVSYAPSMQYAFVS
jgi:hypothetical protein